MKKKFKTIIISDIHLGTKSSKSKEVVKFLKHHKCETLILNGDIIDGWQLKKSGAWKKRHSGLVKYVMKRLAKGDTKIIYLRGNHDDFLDQLLPVKFGNFSIVTEHILESNGKKYYITHGDVFDSITTNFKWLAKLGDISYTFLLWFNRHYNHYRVKRGLPYYSLSQAIKSKVKSAVSFIDDFENHLVKMARKKNCNGIICGHIHTPANKIIDNIHYLNSGDWVETMSALTEDHSGKWQIVYYQDWLTEHEKLNIDVEKENSSNYLINQQTILKTA